MNKSKKKKRPSARKRKGSASRKTLSSGKYDGEWKWDSSEIKFPLGCGVLVVRSKHCRINVGMTGRVVGHAEGGHWVDFSDAYGPVVWMDAGFLIRTAKSNDDLVHNR